MNIQQFNYVLSVVDSKTFEAAAERCYVTQSTLSTMISRFEDEIGVQIFNRKTKPVSITPEGALIIDRLRIIVNEIDSLDNALQEMKGEMKGELKIGVIPTLAPYLLPLFLTKFASKFPRVNIVVKEMTTAQIQKALKNRLLDVGLLAIPLEDDDLAEQELFTEPFLIFDCREEKGQASISIDNLDYDNLWLLQEGHCMRTQVLKICELSSQRGERKLNFQFESGSMGSLLEFTKASKGITIVPYLASYNFSKKDQKNLLDFSAPTPVRSVGLITHKFFVKKQLLEGLIDTIQTEVKDLIPLKDNLTVLKPT